MGIPVSQDPDSLQIHWISRAEIDADGTNGKNDGLFAYRYPKDDGLDRLRNAGWPHLSWDNVLINDGSGHPLTDGNGGAYSQTTYSWPGVALPDRFVDATLVPYVVVNPHVRINSRGAVVGCRALVTYGGRTINTVVADVSGPGTIGEISVRAAQLLGIPESPLTGGVPGGVTFILFPGTPGVVDGVTYRLQKL